MVPLGAVLSLRSVLGSELITRYNLYPAATIIGIPIRSSYSSGQAMNIMEQFARPILPTRHGLSNGAGCPTRRS